MRHVRVRVGVCCVVVQMVCGRVVRECVCIRVVVTRAGACCVVVQVECGRVVKECVCIQFANGVV